ncbi:MAG: ABC transporter [Desulfurococcales archaeon ex4484_58]|nr:MAG: ABC transporter [Desulfurococcales archaeon ex4484_58]
MIGRDISVLLDKELKDLWRDRKTLITTIILPLVMLPLLGIVSLALIAQQPVNVAIVDLDSTRSTDPLLNLTVDSRWLVDNLTYHLHKYGYNVLLANSTQVVSDPDVDVVVVIPEGFSRNATSLKTTAKITVYRKAGYQSAARAESTIHSIVSVFSRNLSNYKLKALSKLAGINATLSALRNPVQAYTELVTVHGVPVSIEVELRNAFARILVLALSFVVTPAASYVIDGIIGERERKTIELLLVSPAPLSHIIYAKMIAATILGIIAAIFDALGLVTYIVLASISYGANIGLIIDYKLLIIHAITAFFTILATITIALPFITRTRGIRSASNVAGIVTTVGIVFFFTGFMIDYVKLSPEILYPLYIIPYVHSILAIQTYMLGYIYRSLLHLLFLAIVSIGLLVFTTKTINSEKLLIAPP